MRKQADETRQARAGRPPERQPADGAPKTRRLDGRFFAGRRIMVTGGTGTVGQEIVRQLLAFKPDVIRVYSRDESKQHQMEHQYGGRADLRFLIGDVRDLPRLQMAMQHVDLVFHCAALKHVKACEYNPFEAVKTNILGTQNVILAALEHEAEKVILTSSDKAVNPSNAMGTSKLMAERLMTAATGMRGPRSTVFASVRFGNVVGSRGSVVPLFCDQIRGGGPVTVTHPGMTRFIMSLEQAVELLLQASVLARGGEVFTLRMPSLKIRDLATVLIEELAGGRPIDIRQVGLLPGEKLYEELLTTEEVQRSEMLEDLYVTYPAINPDGSRQSFGGSKPPRRSYSSRHNGLMQADQIRRFLTEQGVLAGDGPKQRQAS